VSPLLVPATVLPETIGPYISLMILGFVLGVFGHLSRSRWLVAIGIAMIFLATALLPLIINATQEEPAKRPTLPIGP
jgi:predicted benzoate:H+ symporter BenE